MTCEPDLRRTLTVVVWFGKQLWCRLKKVHHLTCTHALLHYNVLLTCVAFPSNVVCYLKLHYVTLCSVEVHRITLRCVTLQSSESPVLDVWLCHLYTPRTSSFAAIIITMATRGRHQTVNINMGHNKSTNMVVFLMRKDCYTKQLCNDTDTHIKLFSQDVKLQLQQFGNNKTTMLLFNVLILN